MMKTKLKQTGTGQSPERIADRNWPEVVLEDLATEITVGYVGSMASEYVKRGIPFLRSQNVDYLRINTDDIKFITPIFHERLRKSSLSPGDVVIVRTGKPGTCAVIPDWLPVANCSDLVIVRCGENLDAHFLAYYVNSLASHHVAAHLVGAVQQHFNIGSARTMRLKLPPVNEQRAIAHILGTLDEKIALNRQMNKTLESVEKTIFKHWFVDFEFPGEEGKPYKSSGGKMVYNEELGEEIPEGWVIKPIDEIANFLNGLALQRYPPENETDTLPVIKIRELNQGISESTDRASSKIPKQYIVDDGDILFSWSGSLEVVIWTSGKGALNQHLFKVTSADFPKWFYYYWIIRYLPEFRNIAEEKATTMGHIQRHHLKGSLVIVPDAATLRKMDKVQAPILERLIQMGIESRTLSQIRDMLLPRLMSGKIRVPVEVR